MKIVKSDAERLLGTGLHQNGKSQGQLDNFSLLLAYPQRSSFCPQTEHFLKKKNNFMEGYCN
jgi:hypothetical protein